MSAPTFTLLAIVFAVLLTVAGKFKSPGEQAKTLAIGLGPQVTSSPL